MHTDVCVRVRACMCIHACIRMRVCVCACMYVHLCMHTDAGVCVRACAYWFLCMHRGMYVCLYAWWVGGRNKQEATHTHCVCVCVCVYMEEGEAVKTKVKINEQEAIVEEGEAVRWGEWEEQISHSPKLDDVQVLQMQNKKQSWALQCN